MKQVTQDMISISAVIWAAQKPKAEKESNDIKNSIFQLTLQFASIYIISPYNK